MADHLGGKKAASPPEKISEPPVIRFHAGRPRVDDLLEAEIEASAPTDWVRAAEGSARLCDSRASALAGSRDFGLKLTLV